MNILNKSVVIAALASATMLVGCEKELPTPEKINAIAVAVGKTAGYACELSKTKPEVKEAIANVLDIASKVVPAEGQTFTEAWTPVIDEELKKLVAARKLDESNAKLVKIALSAACSGIDYVFVKYPKAKDVKELVSAAVEGFVSGYKSIVTCTDCVDNTCTNCVDTVCPDCFDRAASRGDIDKKVYEYIKSHMSK